MFINGDTIVGKMAIETGKAGEDLVVQYFSNLPDWEIKSASDDKFDGDHLIKRPGSKGWLLAETKTNKGVNRKGESFNHNFFLVISRGTRDGDLEPEGWLTNDDVKVMFLVNLNTRKIYAYRKKELADWINWQIATGTLDIVPCQDSPYVWGVNIPPINPRAGLIKVWSV